MSDKAYSFTRPVPRRRARLLAAMVACLIAAVLALQATHNPTRADAATTAKPRVFAYYYLWWSANHWKSSLGPNYPLTASSLPLPATLDASGCGTNSKYVGNVLTDVPSRIYSQDDPGVIESDVRQAAAAGLTGFAVNWAGTGTSSQTVTSNPYSKRLQLMIDAVHKVNGEGIPFKLWLSYKASAVVLSQSYIDNDLHYFLSKYGSDSAFDRAQSTKPTVIWQGSRKYPLSVLQHESSLFRSKLRIIGDESSWSTTRAPYLDGDAYYWSSQDPYKNPQSFQQLAALAANVRASGTNPDGTTKVWVAPFTPGYNKQIAGGSACVPRRGGQTVATLYRGNAATNPDDFGLISWNEITEGSYIDPMTRYGYQDLNSLTSLLEGTSGTSDTTAPSAPTNVTATPGGTAESDLGWTASTDNVGVTGYRVYRDSATTPVATVTGTTLKDTGLSAGSTHSYTVRAVDAAGNLSPASAPASATTAASTGASTVTVAPTDDATVSKATGSTTTNYGKTATLTVDADQSLSDFLLKFTVPTGCTPTAAILTLTAGSGTTNGSAHGGNFYAAPGSWTEATVTAATAPPTTGTPVSLGAVAAGTADNINVTPLLQAGLANSVLSIRATTTSNDAAAYTSTNASTANTAGPTLHLSC